MKATPTTTIHPLSLHDALPISQLHRRRRMRPLTFRKLLFQCVFLSVILFFVVVVALKFGAVPVSLYALGRDLLRDRKSTTSELQSPDHLVCRLLLEKKNQLSGQ